MRDEDDAQVRFFHSVLAMNNHNHNHDALRVISRTKLSSHRTCCAALRYICAHNSCGYPAIGAVWCTTVDHAHAPEHLPKYTYPSGPPPALLTTHDSQLTTHYSGPTVVVSRKAVLYHTTCMYVPLTHTGAHAVQPHALILCATPEDRRRLS